MCPRQHSQYEAEQDLKPGSEPRLCLVPLPAHREEHIPQVRGLHSWRCPGEQPCYVCSSQTIDVIREKSSEGCGSRHLCEVSPS